MSPIEIKAIRIKSTLSQEAFARLVGVTLQTVSRWERGLAKPSPLALEKIKQILGKV